MQSSPRHRKRPLADIAETPLRDGPIVSQGSRRCSASLCRPAYDAKTVDGARPGSPGAAGSRSRSGDGNLLQPFAREGRDWGPRITLPSPLTSRRYADGRQVGELLQIGGAFGMARAHEKLRLRAQASGKMWPGRNESPGPHSGWPGAPSASVFGGDAGGGRA